MFPTDIYGPISAVYYYYYYYYLMNSGVYVRVLLLLSSLIIRLYNWLLFGRCKHQKYRAQLLNASIVVPFHNEHWTTLLRTAQSVFNRSPKHLLHEIILVDDYSSKGKLVGRIDGVSLMDRYPRA